MIMGKPGKRVVVENVNVPDYTMEVNADMYLSMRTAILKILPDKSPGLSQTEIRKLVIRHLPKSLYPGSKKADWWSKAVQLDLEAKGILVREATKPLRWYRKAKK